MSKDSSISIERANELISELRYRIGYDSIILVFKNE